MLQPCHLARQRQLIRRNVLVFGREQEVVSPIIRLNSLCYELEDLGRNRVLSDEVKLTSLIAWRSDK